MVDSGRSPGRVEVEFADRFRHCRAAGDSIVRKSKRSATGGESQPDCSSPHSPFGPLLRSRAEIETPDRGDDHLGHLSLSHAAAFHFAKAERTGLNEGLAAKRVVGAKLPRFSGFLCRHAGSQADATVVLEDVKSRPRVDFGKNPQVGHHEEAVLGKREEALGLEGVDQHGGRPVPAVR